MPGRPAASRCPTRLTPAGRRRTAGSCGAGTRGRRWRSAKPELRGVPPAGSRDHRAGLRCGAAGPWLGSRPASRSSRWPARCARRSSASAIIASRRSILRAQGRDLAVDRGRWLSRTIARRSAGSCGRSEAAARLRVRACLVLEQLADLREREAGVVAQPADEPQALEVLGVVQAVGALGAGGRGEQPELLVVADRPRGEARCRRRPPGCGGGARGLRRGGETCRSPVQSTATLPFT